MATLNPREEIISLLRGYFACPIISNLGKTGLTKLMLQGEFGIPDMPPNVNREVLAATFQYLADIGLLEASGKGPRTCFVATELGKKVLRRFGSFCLLHSYTPYLNAIGDLLFSPPGTDLPQVDRGENILASGQIHSRKYFVPAIDMIRDHKIKTIVDIGCGDGQFLEQILDAFGDVRVVGVDVARRAVDVTRDRLRFHFPEADVATVQSDGADVERWARAINELESDGVTIASMWFLIHEISHDDPERVAQFFATVRKECPKTQLLVGEVTRLPTGQLAKNRHGSIMPELLFFHQLSRQGVLSWKTYCRLRNQIPYEVHAERLFDTVRDESGNEIPSSFVWHLVPR